MTLCFSGGALELVGEYKMVVLINHTSAHSNMLLLQEAAELLARLYLRYAVTLGYAIKY